MRLSCRSALLGPALRDSRGVGVRVWVVVEGGVGRSVGYGVCGPGEAKTIVMGCAAQAKPRLTYLLTYFVDTIRQGGPTRTSADVSVPQLAGFSPDHLITCRENVSGVSVRLFSPPRRIGHDWARGCCRGCRDD